jgi:SAM-dependent methyltransferase
MISVCRSCGSDEIRKVFSLGPAPLANQLADSDRADPSDVRYPLDLCVCTGCSLAQLADAPPPSVLFHDYPYLSSFSDTMLAHAREMASTLIQRFALDRQTLVVEIGSNDGYLLQHFAAADIPVLGVDPSEAACLRAAALGIATRRVFFGRAVADDLVRHGVRPRLLVANNVMAHVPDVNDVMAGVRRLLPADGILVIETPYIRDLIERLEFDTIYHEHMFYYSFTSLTALLERHGFAAIDVTRMPIHGGSIRVVAGSDSSAADAAHRLLEEEAEWGVGDLTTYSTFAARVDARRHELRDLLLTRKRSGRRLAAYGAAAKGVMLLNALDIGPDVLDFVVDRNPRKQGHRLGGSGLPIRPPEDLLVTMPDDVLLLTWNFCDEILEQQAEYRRRGGTFIIPLPEVRIV